jgi:hypothetical protein
MTWQGKKMDTLIHDVVVSKVITDKKQLNRYGDKKSWALFFKQSAIGLLLIALAFVALLIQFFITNHWPDVFDYQHEGFTTLFHIFDWGNEKYYTTVFGIKVLASWPGLLNSPHFEVAALGSYFFLPLFSVGLGWYLVSVLSLISRKLRLIDRKNNIFEKTLEGYNQNTGFATAQQNNPQQAPQQNQIPPNGSDGSTNIQI